MKIKKEEISVSILGVKHRVDIKTTLPWSSGKPLPLGPLVGIFDLCFFPGTLFSLLPITGTKNLSEGQTCRGLYFLKNLITEESPSYSDIGVSQQLLLQTSLQVTEILRAEWETAFLSRESSENLFFSTNLPWEWLKARSFSCCALSTLANFYSTCPASRVQVLSVDL